MSLHLHFKFFQELQSFLKTIYNLWETSFSKSVMLCFDGSRAYQLLLGKMEQNVIEAGESRSCSVGRVPRHVVISVGEAGAPATVQGDHRDLHFLGPPVLTQTNDSSQWDVIDKMAKAFFFFFFKVLFCPSASRNWTKTHPTRSDLLWKCFVEMLEYFTRRRSILFKL